jgi:hypothetical protein
MVKLRHIATFLCLFQANTWISNSLYVVAFSRSIAWGEMWLFFFLIGEFVDHHCLNYIFIESNIHFMKKKIYKQTKSANSDCSQFQQS